MSDIASTYTAGDRARWKKAILKKGGEISAKLEEILNKKDVSLDDLSLWGDGVPGESKEKRLRRFFDHLMARLRVVDHPRFGFDPETNAFLSVPALDEMPWIECEPS